MAAVVRGTPTVIITGSTIVPIMMIAPSPVTDVNSSATAAQRIRPSTRMTMIVPIRPRIRVIRPANQKLARIATAMVAHYHPGDREQMINFMKNVCMAGGFLQVVAFGAGRLCLDRR